MKQFTDYHLYIGAEMHDAYNNQTGKLVGITATGQLYIQHKTLWTMDPSELKLLLRPFKDLTSTEEIEIAKICIGNGDFMIGYRGMGYDQDGIDIHISVRCVRIDVYCSHPMINSYIPAWLLQIDEADDVHPIIIGKLSDQGTKYEDTLIEDPYELTRFLLKQRIDIFKLIRENIALDKTKVNF